MKEKIICPNCKHNVNIETLIYSQISDNIKQELTEKSEADRIKNEAAIRKMISDEKESELKLYKEELERKSDQMKDFNKTKIELERTQREMSELRSSIEADAEAKLSTLVNSEKARIHKEYDEKNNLKLLEKETLIDSLKDQIQILTRKVDQGSMQLQGEVQEIAIEDYLRANFPFDKIIEIKKGARGADCLQEVNSRELSNCGSILYESKNTQAWSGSWIEKFKSDMLLKKAQFGVLVTSVFPSGYDSMALIDGVWVCTISEFKGLCHVLRESALLLKNASLSKENQGDKMQMLYGYLTSNEFRMQVQAIVEGFETMQSELNTERRAMEQIWKRREKQIDKVLLNTNHMFGSIRGIAGSAIGEIKLLELPVNPVSNEKS